MLKLALLLCDTPNPAVLSVHGTYLDIFRSLLENSLLRTRPGKEVDWVLDGYDVVQQVYPTDAQLGEYDAILISGSAASAYAPLAWTAPLYAFIGKVATDYPRIKIFGICFGQQAVAMALGGTCEPNVKGWEVGTYDVELTGPGRLIFGLDILRIQEMHRDHVPSVPPQFELLGSTPKCLVQGFVSSTNKGEPIRSLKDIHILCVQGHPEFVPDIVQTLINVREGSGILDKETASDARIRADAEHDGVDVIGKVIWDILVPESDDGEHQTSKTVAESIETLR